MNLISRDLEADRERIEQCAESLTYNEGEVCTRFVYQYVHVETRVPRRPSCFFGSRGKAVTVGSIRLEVLLKGGRMRNEVHKLLGLSGVACRLINRKTKET